MKQVTLFDVFSTPEVLQKQQINTNIGHFIIEDVTAFIGQTVDASTWAAIQQKAAANGWAVEQNNGRFVRLHIPGGDTENWIEKPSFVDERERDARWVWRWQNGYTDKTDSVAKANVETAAKRLGIAV